MRKTWIQEFRSEDQSEEEKALSCPGRALT